MGHLLSYLKKYKKETVIAPLFKMLEACFDLLVPLIVADIVDNGIGRGENGYILRRFALLVGMAILGLSCTVVAQYFSARAAIGTATGLRHNLLAKIGVLSFTELDTIGTSTLVTRMTSDVTQVQNGINLFLRLFLRSPFIVFGAMVMAFIIDAKIALIFVGVILVLFLIVFGMMAVTKPRYKRVQNALDAVTGEVRENLGGVRVIRAFGREEMQREEFCEANSRLYRAQMKVGRLASLLNPLTYLVINTAIILILWLGSARVEGGVLLSGDIIALINYVSQILVELVKLANTVITLGKASASISRIEEVLATESSIRFGTESADREGSEALRFENVSLRYHGAGDESLSNISFSVLRGETVGIIGGTGSGKSSLVHLIPRFYDATAGEVFLMGKPIRALSREAILSSVAIVDQRPRLFSGTIRENLLWGKETATDEELWQALEIAQAADFVREKPEGLNARVSAGGSNFSGGQRQRLTIARAVVSQADILILDDSMSALDFATDAALRRALRTLPSHMTVFIVSQRTGSIAYADRILVLEDGELVGNGKHDELLTSSPVYREIYESQFKKEGEA
ncbi:MAG: ABC transporter ATP-binding protein [Ruminococcaceae bacterium]|nr:ABC transporter ATP-binding protein [Oscillospiraceae bacterium]